MFELTRLWILALFADAFPRCFCEQMFSVGDLHGDWEQFTKILTRLGLATFDGHQATWTGGKATLVNTGDIVDRGENGRPIYLAYQELAKQAKAEGGEVINIIGNHELMNLQHDFRYVHDSEWSPQGDYGGKKQRMDEWSTKGIIGQDIRTRFVAAAVRNSVLFVHGGLSEEVLRLYGDDAGALDNLNDALRQAIRAPRAANGHRLFMTDGPFWNRNLVYGKQSEVCPQIERTLLMLNARMMVVGHTPQDAGVNGRCLGTGYPLILGDTIISRAYEDEHTKARASAIEFNGDDIVIHYFPDGQEGSERKVYKLPKPPASSTNDEAAESAEAESAAEAQALAENAGQSVEEETKNATAGSSTDVGAPSLVESLRSVLTPPVLITGLAAVAISYFL